MRKIRDIVRNSDGAAIIEFALVGPLVIAMMIAVLQLGMMMQSYNAVRSVTAETARFALVEYQKGNTPNNATIREAAIDIADGAPYLMNPTNLKVEVSDAGVQRVDRAKELTVNISYQAPSFLPFFDWVTPAVSHERPIFLLDN
jgi:Flp pilus assembly protein TadG